MRAYKSLYFGIEFVLYGYLKFVFMNILRFYNYNIHILPLLGSQATLESSYPS